LSFTKLKHRRFWRLYPYPFFRRRKIITSIPSDTTAIDVARAQFGFVIAFHIVFPAFSIGLASYLSVLEACWLWTRRLIYIDAYKYWLKIFAMIF